MSDPSMDRWHAPRFPEHDLPTAGELEQVQEQAYQEAFRQGLDEGRQQGYDEGMARAAGDIEQQVAILDNLVGHLAAPLARLEESLETELVEMVHALVSRLFRRQIRLDPDVIVGLVRDAVGLLPSSSNTVTVTVHPDDAARLQALKSGTGNPSESRWNIVSDPGISPGGCRVVCGQSLVDATVEARMQQLASSLIGDERGE